MYLFLFQADESYHNLSLIFNLMKPYNFVSEHGLFTYAFDLKLTLEWFGLGKSASTYRCARCIMPYTDFDSKEIDENGTPKYLAGGQLRSLDFVKEQSDLYQAAKERHKGKSKLTSSPYFNCENTPIDITQLPGETLILHVCPPPPLHTKMGLFNKKFDIMEALLKHFGFDFSLETWTGGLGIEREDHYGGQLQFSGRQCSTLMSPKNIEKLFNLLTERNAIEQLQPAIDTLKSFIVVNDACMGLKIKDANYKEKIKNYADSYLRLMAYCKTLDIPLGVITKAHDLWVHVPQFLNFAEVEKGLVGVGMGKFSEQAPETSHKDFKTNYWEGGKCFKRSTTHEDYPQNFFRSHVVYAADHLGSKSTE